MTDLERIKNEVALDNGFETWFGLIDAYPHSTMSPEKLNELENEAMQRYAELKCKEQRLIDASAMNYNHLPKEILDAPLATSKTK